MAGKSKKYKDFPSQAGLYVEVVSRCTPKKRLWGKVVRRVAQLQAKGYQSTCSNTRKFMCNLLLRKSDGKKARFIIIIKNRCIFGCNDFFALYKGFSVNLHYFHPTIPLFSWQIIQRFCNEKFTLDELLQRFIKFQMLCIFERLSIVRLLRKQV